MNTDTSGKGPGPSLPVTTNPKRGVIQLFHDNPAARHPGIANTYALTKQDFWWPSMRQDIEQYVKGCTICQESKINTRPLKPAIVTERRGNSYYTVMTHVSK